MLTVAYVSLVDGGSCFDPISGSTAAQDYSGRTSRTNADVQLSS